MNINMLRDLDNDAGFYAAASGYNDDWRSAGLYCSSDSGASYQPVISFTAAATIGSVSDVLGDFDGGNIPDELNIITVRLDHGTLSSVSFDTFLSGAQAAVIGSEIVCFRNAVLNLDGTYTVSGLLRGRCGSEYAMGTHVAGERFVLVNAGTFVRVAGVTADIGIAKLYKAVTDGATLASTTSQSFTNTGAGLKPYSVAHIGGGRNAANDVTITWVRRARISGEWRDSVDVPLGEESEAYAVEIWDSGYTTLLRTISGLSSSTTTYSAADQATDGITPGDPVYIKVFQLSGLVGRGYEARGTI